MSRSTNDILDQLLRQLPTRYRAYAAVLAGGAAGLAGAEALWADLADASTIGGAEGALLKLRARGFGVYQQADETDDTLRRRIRTIEDQATPAAILAAVNAILADFTEDTATMVEPWDDGFLDDETYADAFRLVDWWNAFLLVVPLVGEWVAGSDYLGSVYADDAYLGAPGEEHPVYEAIRAAVNRTRAAGVRASMAIEIP